MSEKTPDEVIAEATERRARNRAAFDVAHKAQFAIDFVALVDLEEKHGFGRVLRVDLGGWKADVGAATLCVVRLPEGRDADFRRFEQTVAKAKREGTTQNLEAAHFLARACLLYPSEKEHPDLYKATLNLADGILTNLANQIAEAVQGKSPDEKKG